MFIGEVFCSGVVFFGILVFFSGVVLFSVSSFYSGVDFFSDGTHDKIRINNMQVLCLLVKFFFLQFCSFFSSGVCIYIVHIHRHQAPVSKRTFNLTLDAFYSRTGALSRQLMRYSLIILYIFSLLNSFYKKISYSES